ncbi:MAG TPA: thiamine pyrophosphate-binding protein [Gaiellaceae bacterium]|nr:thiamine pyrophosphate-binding protein [Gaiellaceae bacterium]
MPDTVSISGGEALARTLAAAGVRHVFGVPAGKLGPFLEALAAAPDGPRWVGTRHEAAAAWMAAASFHAGDGIAVCCGESGPGSHNLVGGLGSARANNLAVLVLTPGAPSHLAYPFEGMAMDSDNLVLFAPVTKWNAVVREPARIPSLVRRALREALTGRPGPVHLEVPADVLAQTVELAVDELEGSVPPARTRADDGEVERAAALLASAERPLVISGGGVTMSDASDLLRTVAARIGAAATATQMGLGTVATDGAGFVGHGGIIGGEAVVRALTEADVVLAVGCRFSSWLWCGPGEGVRGRPEQELIQIDVDPAAIGAYRPVSVGLCGDAPAVLEQLLEALGDAEHPRSAWVEGLVAEHRAYLEGLRRLGDGGDAMHPAALTCALAAALPKDALAVYDGGHTTFWSNDLIPATAPRTRFHEPGMAHLGFGTPYANALALLHPGRPVVQITGDGAFGFTVQELDTARRLGLAPVHVVHDNAAWGVIRLGQSRAGFELGTDLEGTDYGAVARGFGCHGERIERPEEVAPALERALASGLPSVIDAVVSLAPHPGLPRFAATARR